MAWITKPSATTSIPRRAEPYLTAAMREELTNKILPRYATKQGGTLSALHMIQEEYHWIPPPGPRGDRRVPRARRRRDPRHRILL